MVAHSGGAVGANVGTLPLDTPLSELKSEGSQSYLEWIRASVQGREATIRDMGIIMSKSTRVAGTPEQIATQLEVWRDAGIDGINVINMTIPGSYVEFIEQVMPDFDSVVSPRKPIPAEAFAENFLAVTGYPIRIQQRRIATHFDKACAMKLRLNMTPIFLMQF